MIKKTLQPTNELCIQFSDEEIQELGLEQGQRFEVQLTEEGAIKLIPFAKIELELEDWPRKALEAIIKESCERDISAGDVIVDMIKNGLQMFEKDECCGSGCCDTASHDMLYHGDIQLNTSTYSTDIDPNFTNNDTSITNN